jgi:hypothetical protein
MRFWMSVVALTTFSAPGLAQDKKDAKEDPDLLYKKELGVSIQKPAKNDEWEFKDQGFFQGMQLIVAHKVDSIHIEIFSQEKAPGTTYYDPKKAAEDEWRGLAGSADFKDCKKVQDIKAAKLPNGGANNPMSYLLDMTMKEKAGKSMELKVWSFVGKENQNFYRVMVIGDEGMYKKHQKNLDLMLGSIRILRIPK